MHGGIARCAVFILVIGLAVNRPSMQAGAVAVAPPELGPSELGNNANGEVRSDVDVLARGPIHEAFAEQVNRDPRPSQVIPQQPPETIEELPPDFRPQGKNVIWIAGYWAWDDERQDFIWVSGLWRDVPPHRRWVPGYWNQSEPGYQWISGFWADVESEQLEYLEAPPASLEHGPSSAAPGDNYFWSPGCWVFRDALYHWRPGYWQPYRENWIWVPARYLWSPGGCIYVSGYWDYRVAYRGQLFAPAYFHHPVYARPGYCYTPSHVITTAGFFLHLFVSLHDRHYYFGDYYGRHPAPGNFCSHAYFHRRGYGYDPLFVYYRHHYRRHGIDYAHRLHKWHVYLDKHQDHRPARTARGQLEFAKHHRDHQQLDHLLLARALDQEVAHRRAGRKLVPVGKAQKAVVAQDISELRNLSRKRSQLEGRAATTARHDIDRARDLATSPPVTLNPRASSRRPAGQDRSRRSEPPSGTRETYSKRHVVARGEKKSEQPRRLDIARPSVPTTRVGDSNRSRTQLRPQASLPARPRPSAQPNARNRTDRMNRPRTPQRPPGKVKVQPRPKSTAPRARPQTQPRRRTPSASAQRSRGGSGRKARPQAKPSGRGKRQK